MEELSCATIWGGVRNLDTDFRTKGIDGSLYSHAAEGRQGGDIYYISVCSADSLTRVALADVVGHGEEVSAISRWLFTALESGMNNPDGGAVLEQLNRRVFERDFPPATTAAVLTFHRGEGAVYFAYAGHPPVYLRPAGSARFEPARLAPNAAPRNLPLGVAERCPYDQGRAPLGPGDALVLYTDGLIDARNDEAQFFGNERLEAVIDAADRATPGELKRSILDAVHTFAGGDTSHDDLTLMVMEVR